MKEKNESVINDIIAYKIDEDIQIIYANPFTCAIELGIDDSTIYSRLNTGSFKPYQGYLFKHINDKRKFIIDEPKVMDSNAKKRVLDKVISYNIITGETKTFNTIKECSSCLRISYSTIYKQLSTGEQLPMHKHLFKWNNDVTDWRVLSAEEVIHYSNDLKGRQRYVESFDGIVKESFDYNPHTGILWRKHVWRNMGNVKVGDIVNTRDDRGYIQASIANKTRYAHQIIWFLHYGYWAKEIDHNDKIKHHNWIDNLREVTRSENCQNFGYSRGYNKTPSGKFICRITANRIIHHLGTVPDEKTAIRVVHEGRLKYQPGYLGN